MNPYKKMITDEASGILVENQRYLDYRAGARAMYELIMDDKYSVVKFQKDKYLGFIAKLRKLWGMGN